MKKRVMAVLLTALTVYALTACTQGTSGSSNEQAGVSQTQGSGTIAAGADTLAGVGTGSQTAAEGSSGSGTVNDGTAGGTASDNTSGSTSASGESTSGSTAENGSVPGDTSGAPSDVSNEDTEAATDASAEGNYTDEEYNAVSDGTVSESDVEGWSGTYVSDSGETLTIAIQDAETISFSFTNAGIAKTAALNGNQATYHGDDQHVIVFDYTGSTIQVSVLSEEDFDASGSPMNGVYTRQ